MGQIQWPEGRSTMLHQRERFLDPLFRLVSLLGFKEMYDLSGSEVTCQVAALLHTTGLPSHARRGCPNLHIP